MSVYEQYIQVFGKRQGALLSTAEIAEEMRVAFSTTRTGVLPSDYCYNVWNLPIRRRRYLFELVEKEVYRYLGPDYPYSGPMVWRPRNGGPEVVVGQWSAGKQTMFFRDADLEARAKSGVDGESRAWFTTHWPRREGEQGPQSGVYVQDGKEHVLQDMRVGDLVWIYESDSGKTVVRTAADGSKHQLRCLPGRQGVVALCQVTAPPMAAADAMPENYTDGDSKWWRWQADTTVLSSSGFIPREVAAGCLGYKPNYVFRGFGAAGSGIRRITNAEHASLLARFTSAAIDGTDAVLERAARTAESRRGGEGEGELHRRIKDKIAADPATCLQETGLTLVRKEYPYATGDRVDVLLRDQYGRYITVEVEPTCNADEICGPLQSMKYRAMLAYLLDVPVGEVRSMLVAPEIHPAVRKRCSEFDVEVREFAG